MTLDLLVQSSKDSNFSASPDPGASAGADTGAGAAAVWLQEKRPTWPIYDPPKICVADFSAHLKYPPFRPVRSYPAETRLQLLLSYAATLLPDNCPRMSVALPPNVKTKAWIAVNIYLYYNKANEFLGYIKQQCNCPSMTIARKYEYLWADGSTVKTPINLPAIDYAGHVMLWIEGYLDDPTFFPEKDGASYLFKFSKIAKLIFKRLFRVFGHMHTMHRGDVHQAGIAQPLDKAFACFVQFAKTFRLLKHKTLHPIHHVMDRWDREQDE